MSQNLLKISDSGELSGMSITDETKIDVPKNKAEMNIFMIKAKDLVKDLPIEKSPIKYFDLHDAKK